MYSETTIFITPENWWVIGQLLKLKSEMQYPFGSPGNDNILGVSKNKGTPKRMVYNGKPY